MRTSLLNCLLFTFIIVGSFISIQKVFVFILSKLSRLLAFFIGIKVPAYQATLDNDAIEKGDRFLWIGKNVTFLSMYYNNYIPF